MDISQGINVAQALAPFYWGFVVSLFLGGMTIVQAYIYFPAQHDRFFVRFTAAVMLIFDMVSSVLVAQSVYYYLIPNFGSLLPFDSVTPELSADCLISSVITFISQIYFVYQLYTVKRLDKSRWLVLGSIIGCAVMTLCSGIGCVTTMIVLHHGVLFNRSRTFTIFFGIAKGFGALTDMLATVAMCIYLSSSKTGVPSTNNLLHKLMRFVIHRGALVTLIHTLVLITFYAAPGHLYWIAFHFNVTKLYANTFYAMLNARSQLKAESHTHSGQSLSKIGFHSEQYDLRGIEVKENDGRSKLTAKNMPTVSVSTTVEMDDI